MTDKQNVSDLKNDFTEAGEGYYFDLDRNIGAILDDMAIGYAAALGHDRNLSLILELHPATHS